MSKQHLSVPPGWKLVPIEPTVPMVVLAAESLCCEFDPHTVGPQAEFMLAVYREFLAAAPEPEYHVEQEPVAWMDDSGYAVSDAEKRLNGTPSMNIPLYTAPPAAPDVSGLVEALEEIANWPNGGQKYGQVKIKEFAATTLSAYREQQGDTNHD